MFPETKKDNEFGVLLYLHLGLGDHIMCHGIVREYCKKYKRVAIFSWPQNYVSVSFMFRDLKNLLIIKGDEKFAREVISENAISKPEYDLVKIIGYEFLDRSGKDSLEKQFYKLAGVSLSKKWDSFYIERDYNQEKKFFEKFAPKKEYTFVHDDKERGFAINDNKIGKKLDIFHTNRTLTNNVFDYCTLIEKAKEIHVIDSSFMFLIDCIDYINPSQKLFIHRYARYNKNWKLPVLKKKWNIISFNISVSGILKYLKYNMHDIKDMLRSITKRANE